MLPILFYYRLVSERRDFIVALFCLEIFLLNAVTLILFLFFKVNQNSLMFWHILIETSLISLILKGWMKERINITIMIALILLFNVTGFLFFYCSNALVEQVRLSMFSLVINILLALFSIFCIVYTYIFSNKESLIQDKIFILSSGILLYNGLQIYISVFESLIRSNLNDLFFFTWPIMQICTILYHISITRAVWILKS